MKRLLETFSDRSSTWMEIAAGVVLIGIMLLIGTDIVGRGFGRPVPGAYELVSLAGGLIIGLALPATSKAKEHVSTDLLLAKLPPRPRRLLTVLTRSIGIAIFLLAGYGMVQMGIRLKFSGEVTAVLALPFYYVCYTMGGAFLVQTLVLFSELLGTVSQMTER